MVAFGLSGHDFARLCLPHKLAVDANQDIGFDQAQMSAYTVASAKVMETACIDAI